MVFYFLFKEANRDLLVEHAGAVAALVSTLTSENPDVAYPACGAILNTSMDNGIYIPYVEPLQIALLKHDALPNLTRIVKLSLNGQEYSKISCGMAIRAISNLVETGLT